MKEYLSYKFKCYLAKTIPRNAVGHIYIFSNDYDHIHMRIYYCLMLMFNVNVNLILLLKLYGMRANVFIPFTTLAIDLNSSSISVLTF